MDGISENGLVSLLFMLEGEAICLNELGWGLSLAKANRLQAKYEQKGIYGIGFTCKKNISLSIAFHPEWLQSTCQNLEHIMLLLQHFLDASVPYMSISVLIRNFRKELGTSPHEYQKEQRMRLAHELLARKMPPKEVFSLVGYSDVNTFRHEIQQMQEKNAAAGALRPFYLRYTPGYPSKNKAKLANRAAERAKSSHFLLFFYQKKLLTFDMLGYAKGMIYRLSPPMGQALALDSGILTLENVP